MSSYKSKYALLMDDILQAIARSKGITKDELIPLVDYDPYRVRDIVFNILRAKTYK